MEGITTHPDPLNRSNQTSLSSFINWSVIIRISSSRFLTRAEFVLNLGSVGSEGTSITLVHSVLNCTASECEYLAT